MNDKRIHLLSKEPVPKAIMTLAVPAIIGMLVMSIYNLVDTMFVAWLGTEATGATQVVFPIMMLITAIGLAFGIGGASYISRLIGQNRKERAEQVLMTNTVSALVMGIVFFIIVVLFIEPILTLFGATESIMTMAKGYGIIIALGAPFQAVNMNFNNLLRSEGSAKYSMVGMATGALLNIILDPILIFGFDMGIEGAAIATTFSQFVTTIILSSYYLRNKTLLHFHISKVSFDKALVTEVMKMGSPSFVKQVLVSLSMGFMNTAASKYGGEAGIAAIGIVARTMMLPQFIIFGFAQGFQVVAGYNYGAKAFQRLKESVHFTSIVSLSFGIVSSIVLLSFDDAILSIFNPTAEVVKLAKPFIIAYGISNVLMSVSNVVTVYFQALGKGMAAFILSVSRQGIFLIPLLLILPNTLNLYGVVISQPIADVLTLVTSIGLFLPAYKKALKPVYAE